jgi:hypothetical protein
MRGTLAGLTLALFLLGCGQADMASRDTASSAGGEAGYAAMGGVAPEAAPAPPPMEAQNAPATSADDGRTRGVDADMAQEERQEAQGPGQPSRPTGPAPVMYLAYSYQVGLELPAARVNAVMESHVQACQAAGPRLCQLVGSNVSGDPDSYISGYVAIRGEPTWLRGFMNGLEAQADEAGGRLKSRTVQSEDLTRQIVDTEARLRAQTALRDRLQELLRSRPGRLADLLEVERELARVQGEIDAVQSALAVMRTRVSMSELNLSYESRPQAVGSDTFQPLRDAFANFLGIVVGGFAAIIVIIAGLIPFAVVIVPIVWLLLRWRKARGGRFWRRNEPPPAAPPPT